VIRTDADRTTVRGALFGCLIGVTVLAAAAQIIIEPSLVNAASACIILVSSLSVLLYMRWSRALETHPLSTFALFGFCVTNQLAALLAQTAAWTPVSRWLYDPLYTFGTIAFYQAIAHATHCVYRFFSLKRPPDRQPLRRFCGWIGIYTVPRAGSLWVMGCVGLCAMVISRSEGIIGKIAGGFSFLTWAPFLVIFYLSDQGQSYCNAKLNKAFLVCYVGAIGIVGMALNTRAVIFVGVVTVSLLFLFTGMRSKAPVTGRALFRLGALGLILLAISVPASDLVASMAIARQWRGKVSPTEMIKTTLYIWGKPSLIAAARAHGEAAGMYAAYDERYVANPLLNRLVNTKYLDNSLHFGRSLTSDGAQERLRRISAKFAWAGLPTPLLGALGIQVSKEDLAYSMGDYMAYLSRGLPLGGHLIGSMFAQGIVLFGPLFPFVYAAICLILFCLTDLLTLRPARGAATLAALGMLQIWSFFINGIQFDGLHLVLYFVLRNFEQMVLIYVLVLGLSRLLLSAQSPARLPAVPALQRGVR
jgi:hypothetical protein